MADTKQGREKKALAREKRQREWELERELAADDEAEPILTDGEGEGNA